MGKDCVFFCRLGASSLLSKAKTRLRLQGTLGNRRNKCRLLPGHPELGCVPVPSPALTHQAVYHSVHEKIFTLPGDCLIYPAHDYHGEGFLEEVWDLHNLLFEREHQTAVACRLQFPGTPLAKKIKCLGVY